MRIDNPSLSRGEVTAVHTRLATRNEMCSAPLADSVLRPFGPMESSRCSQRWKTLPEFKYSRRCSSVTAKDDKTVRDGGQRSVTLAPASRYLTDRRYTARKPLFSAEQQISILKKTNPATQTEKVRSTREINQMCATCKRITCMK